MRVQFVLRCTECTNENYIMTKNKKTHPGRMVVKKFCPKCNKQTMHREKK